MNYVFDAKSYNCVLETILSAKKNETYLQTDRNKDICLQVHLKWDLHGKGDRNFWKR